MTERLCDPFGRQITTLRVSVTDRCNLRCVYCIPLGGLPLCPREALLRFEEIAEVVRAATDLGIWRIKLTGGEPLMRRHIDRLVAMLAAVAGVENLSLTTNGTLLAPLAARLRAAGLQRVTVSLDTLRPERFRRITRGGDLAQVTAGIEAARAAGLAPIKLNVVVLRGVNDDEVADFARLTLDDPLEVRFIELMRVGSRAEGAGAQRTRRDCFEQRHRGGDSGASTNRRTPARGTDRFVPMDEIRARLEQVGPLEAAGPAAGPALRLRLVGAAGTLGLIAPISEPFCGRCSRLRLTAQGGLRSCLLADAEVSLMPALRPNPDPEALRAALRGAAAAKPLRHTGRLCAPMSRIGG